MIIYNQLVIGVISVHLQLLVGPYLMAIFCIHAIYLRTVSQWTISIVRVKTHQTIGRYLREIQAVGSLVM